LFDMGLFLSKYGWNSGWSMNTLSTSKVHLDSSAMRLLCSCSLRPKYAIHIPTGVRMEKIEKIPATIPPTKKAFSSLSLVIRKRPKPLHRGSYSIDAKSQPSAEWKSRADFHRRRRQRRTFRIDQISYMTQTARVKSAEASVIRNLRMIFLLSRVSILGAATCR
jgi:hypothetical protein